MANLTLTLISLACVLACCLAGNSRNRRSFRVRRQIQGGQAQQQCPQSDGIFTVQDGTCQSFFVCEAGTFMGVQYCPGRLMFDPNSGQCERVVNGCPQNPANQICDANQNPGNPNEAFKVSHPLFCNAFFTCEPNWAQDICEVCGNGTYFSENTGTCAALVPGNTPSECQGKETVPDGMKTIMRLKNNCHIFDKDEYDALLAQNNVPNGSGSSGGQFRPQQGNRGQFGGK